MKQLNFEEKKILAAAQPITRKFFFNKLQNGSELTPDFVKRFEEINSAETDLYQKWHKKCLSDMKRVKLHLTISELFEQIADPEVNVKQALAIAKRAQRSKKYENKRKQVEKMIDLLQSLAERESKIYYLATERLESNPSAITIALLGNEIGTLGAINSEDLLYLKQSIKHVNCRRALKAPVSVHELYQALEPRFAYMDKIYDQQIQIVVDSCNNDGAIPEDIKDVIFEFIRESAKVVGRMEAKFVACLFKNWQVSNKAFKLFSELEDIIKSNGINYMIACMCERIIERRSLKEKKLTELTDSDLNIIRLCEMFRN